MDTRLEIAWMVHEHNSPDVAARESLFFADALIAAHEATAKPVLPEDAPVEGEALPLWKQLVELGKQIPDAEWANVPTDLCRNLGRYLYGGDDALPDDAPVMEWRITLFETVCKGEFWRGKPKQKRYFVAAEAGGDYCCSGGAWDRDGAAIDLPAVRAAAVAYSAAKGYRAVFTGEGAE